MWSPSAVCVDDDFTSCQAGISVRTSDFEFTRGVDDEFSVCKHLLGDDFLDDLVDENLSNSLVGDTWLVLGGDENVVDSKWGHSTI